MSRIIRNPVVVPDGVTVQVDKQVVKAKGKLGELSLTLIPEVSVTLDGKNITVARADGLDHLKKNKKKWNFVNNMRATTHRNITNMIKGVTEGFDVKLKMVGVGYRAAVKGNILELQVGKSHNDDLIIPKGVKVAVEKQTDITLSGADKEELGQFGALIRGCRPPEPYKGKGIRYEDEYVETKEGKKK